MGADAGPRLLDRNTMSTNWSSVWSPSGPIWSRAWSTRLLMNGIQGSRRGVCSCQGTTFWTFALLNMSTILLRLFNCVTKELY